MKRFIFIMLILTVYLIACSKENAGNRTMLNFSNPILAGFYPDPSICRVESDYYLVTSTFAYFPGIPIFHSTDLVNWNLIGHVMDRPEQMNLDGLGVSRGIFAPAIRYNNGMFYVTCTLVDAGGNFIVTSKNPAGLYSNPVWIPQINGIDPSMFFDENGKAYIIYNSIAPDDKPLYDGHRTIRMYEFDIENLKVIGEEILLIDGGADISKEPIWIEAPHIFQKDGYYYLIAAEGGTAEQHSEVVFRSKNVDSPYVPYENNPILTQRHLDSKRKDPITSTGHADFVQTETGEWWAVFLGCRPYPPVEENYYNTGRETFLAPVRWIDGWPIINPDFDEVQYHYPFPIEPITESRSIPYSGNFKIRDDFDNDTLDLHWVFLRTPHQKWYDLTRQKSCLTLELRPETCADRTNPSFLGRRQQHARGYASASLRFTPEFENEKAGLLVFQNERHFYLLCKSLDNDEPVVQLYQSTYDEGAANHLELIASQKIELDEGNQVLFLKIEAHGNTYSFHYGLKPDQWNRLKENVDATFLSTRVAGGFVGCVYALYATSLGKPSQNIAYFDWFEYQGDDEIYK